MSATLVSQGLNIATQMGVTYLVSRAIALNIPVPQTLLKKVLYHFGSMGISLFATEKVNQVSSKEIEKQVDAIFTTFHTSKLISDLRERVEAVEEEVLDN